MLPIRKWNALQQEQLEKHASAQPAQRLHEDHCRAAKLPRDHFGSYWCQAPKAPPRSKEAEVQKAVKQLCTLMRSCDIKNLAMHVLFQPCGCNDDAKFQIGFGDALATVPANQFPVICRHIDSKFSAKKIVTTAEPSSSTRVSDSSNPKSEDAATACAAVRLEASTQTTAMVCPSLSTLKRGKVCDEEHDRKRARCCLQIGGPVEIVDLTEETEDKPASEPSPQPADEVSAEHKEKILQDLMLSSHADDVCMIWQEMSSWGASRNEFLEAVKIQFADKL